MLGSTQSRQGIFGKVLGNSDKLSRKGDEMIVEDRQIIPWNDGSWSEPLYYLSPQPEKQPRVFIDDIECFIYEPMCQIESGLELYYKSRL